MKPIQLQFENSVLRKVLKRLHYPLEIMLLCVRWYAAHPLSVRHLEEMMLEKSKKRIQDYMNRLKRCFP